MRVDKASDEQSEERSAEQSAEQPAELVGLWDSVPYSFGAMETTTLALLDDGRGWTAVNGLPGLLGLRRLTWRRASTGVIELRYTVSIDSESASEPDYEFVRAQYTLLMDTSVLQPEPFQALHLTVHVDFARQFGLMKRDVSIKDDPAYELVPYIAA